MTQVLILNCTGNATLKMTSIAITSRCLKKEPAFLPRGGT